MFTTTSDAASASLSRRTLLGSIPVAAFFVLTGCSSNATATGSATAEATGSASATAATAGSTASGSVVKLAQAFQATLSSDLQSQLLQDYSLSKEAAFAALLAGLSTDQLAAAKLSKIYSDLVLGPGQDWAFPAAREGVQASTLSDAQKKLALAAIAGYVNDIADSDAATILTRYESELDDTYIAHSGTAALTEQNDYVRINGPSVWIGFSMQRGIVLSGNHPHSVWRDRTTDYGGTKS